MILTDDVVNSLASLDERAVINTYNLISTVVPQIIREGDSVVISSNDKSIDLTYFDQCLFEVISEFTYTPLWYVYKEIKVENIQIDPLEKIKLWRDLGIIFIDSQTNGDFLRPTNYLYKLLNKSRKPYKTIPYNMLSHDISKIDLYFKAISGKSLEIKEILEEEIDVEIIDSLIIEPNDVLNLRSDNKNNEVLNLLEGNKVDFNKKEYYLNVIDESQIKIAKSNESKISQIENKIIEEIKSGERFTFELRNSEGFFSAVIKGKSYILQFPDLIIPIKRDPETGKPNSIAIEMELTAKPLANYEKNLLKYKNSLKFGSVAWFCGNTIIKNRIHEAYRNIGGTGFTSVYVYEYTPPRRQEIEIISS